MNRRRTRPPSAQIGRTVRNSLVALNLALVILGILGLGCSAPLVVITPQDLSIVYEKTIPIHLEYTQCDPTTLKVLLNGTDITPQMEVSEAVAYHPAAPLAFGPNMLVATIQTLPNRSPIKVRITFYRLVPYESYALIDNPSALAFDAEGALYIGRDEPGPVPIERVPPGGGPARSLGPPLTRPKALTIDPEGNLFVASVDTVVQLYKIGQDGRAEPVLRNPAPFQDVHSLLFMPKATNYLAYEYGPCLFATVTTFEGSRTLIRIDPAQGTFHTFAQGLPESVGALVPGADGNLHVLADQGLYRITTRHSFSEHLRCRGLRSSCLVSNRDGIFFSVDDREQRIVSLTAFGPVFPFTDVLGDVTSLALGPDGYLYFSDRSMGGIFRIPYDFHSLLTGTVNFSPQGPIVAGSFGTWAITYTTGIAGMAKNGQLVISPRHPMDWGDFQTFFPTQPNYLRVTCSKPETFFTVVPGFDGIHLTLWGAPLERWDTVSVTLGDMSKGSPGQRAPTIAQEDTELFVFDDIYGIDDFAPLSTIPPQKSPRYDVIAAAADHIVVAAKSYGATHDPLTISLRAADAFGNTAADYSGTLTLRDAVTNRLLATVRFSPVDKGFKIVRNVRFPQQGIKRILVEDAVRGWRTISNPIVISKDSSSEKVFWGDIHGHSFLSDGLPSPEHFYETARDINQLDFAALSDHVGPPWYASSFAKTVLNESSYELIKAAAQSYYAPGVFVTFVGFECSVPYGHRNVYYAIADPPFVQWDSDPLRFFQSVRSSAPLGQVMIVGHQHSGIPYDPTLSGIDWNLFASDLEKTVEICSNKGVREYAGNPYFECDKDALLRGSQQVVTQDALAMGLRFGFVCNSDNHTGWPGGGAPGGKTCPIFGLTGIRARSLTRESLFEAYTQKRTIATTGARIIVDLRLNGEPMGSELPFTTERILEVEIHATAAVSSVDVIKNNRLFYSHTLPEMDIYFSLADSPSLASDFYYVRVLQQDGHIAWSSPIWVGP